MEDLKMQKQTLKKAYKKTKRKHITPWKILAIICAVVMIVSIPLSILLQKFDNTMAARFGAASGSCRTRTPTPSITPVTSTPPRRWSTTVWL